MHVPFKKKYMEYVFVKREMVARGSFCLFPSAVGAIIPELIRIKNAQWPWVAAEMSHLIYDRY